MPISGHHYMRVLNVYGFYICDINVNSSMEMSLGITLGLQALTAQAQKQLGYGEYNIIVVTDGQHSAGYNPDAIVSELIEETPIVIHTIGFCLSNNHTLNRKGHTIYKAANNPAAQHQASC